MEFNNIDINPILLIKLGKCIKFNDKEQFKQMLEKYETKEISVALEIFLSDKEDYRSQACQINTIRFRAMLLNYKPITESVLNNITPQEPQQNIAAIKEPNNNNIIIQEQNNNIIIEEQPEEDFATSLDKWSRKYHMLLYFTDPKYIKPFNNGLIDAYDNINQAIRFGVNAIECRLDMCANVLRKNGDHKSASNLEDLFREMRPFLEEEFQRANEGMVKGWAFAPKTYRPKELMQKFLVDACERQDAKAIKRLQTPTWFGKTFLEEASNLVISGQISKNGLTALIANLSTKEAIPFLTRLIGNGVDLGDVNQLSTLLKTNKHDLDSHELRLFMLHTAKQHIETGQVSPESSLAYQTNVVSWLFPIKTDYNAYDIKSFIVSAFKLGMEDLLTFAAINKNMAKILMLSTAQAGVAISEKTRKQLGSISFNYKMQ